jgi:DNA modification methylase
VSVRIIQGDAIETLRTLPADSVQCVVTSPPYFDLRSYLPDGHPDKHKEIGQEASPIEYIAAIVSVFREVRRVLRPDGVCWLNLSDTYASGWPCRRRSTMGAGSLPDGTRAARPPRLSGFKDKDLMMIPARVAIALCDDGWWLRSEVVWNKTNPMVESVTDRPTNCNEKVYLLAKAAKYFYDHEVVKEAGVIPAGTKGAKGSADRAAQRGVNSRPPEYKVYDGTRNLRNVWTIATEIFPGAHYATMPTKLAETCIKAGSRPGNTVLDPFAGAGTTGVVADRLGRHAILVELSCEYVALARRRIEQDGGLFAEVAAE